MLETEIGKGIDGLSRAADLAVEQPGETQNIDSKAYGAYRQINGHEESYSHQACGCGAGARLERKPTASRPCENGR